MRSLLYVMGSYCMKRESRKASWVIVTLGLDCSAGFRGRSAGLALRPPHTRAPKVIRCKLCLTFHKDDEYH